MNQALSVSRVKRIGNLDAVTQHLLQRQCTSFQSAVECLPFQELKHEIVGLFSMTDVVENTNVRMVEAGDRPCLLLEAFATLRVGGKFRGKDFDCDRAFQ